MDYEYYEKVTVEEARKLKSDLELDISNLIRKFTKRTGLAVHRIEVDGYGSSCEINIRAELP
jgi:hypothetical protein